MAISESNHLNFSKASRKEQSEIYPLMIQIDRFSPSTLIATLYLTESALH